MSDQIESNDVERIPIEGELRLRETAKESGWSLASVGPGYAAIIAAGVALISGLSVAWMTGYFNLSLEERKLRSSLILKSVETKDPKEAVKMLRFFVDLGFLEDTTGAIAEYEKNPERIPLRPRASGPDWDYGSGNWGGYSYGDLGYGPSDWGYDPSDWEEEPRTRAAPKKTNPKGQ